MSEYSQRFSVTQDIAQGIVRVHVLDSEIRSAVTTSVIGVVESGDELVVWYENTPSPAEESAVADVVRDHDPLEAVKAELVGQIGDYVGEVIENGPGVEYPPASGNFFSVTQTAQAKWNGFYNTRDKFTYPYLIPTKDDKTLYAIQSAAEVEAMYLTMAAFVAGALGQATAAKQAVWAATTIDAAQTAAAAYLGSP